MRKRGIRWLLSIVLIAGGAFLIFQGARIFIESRWGQTEAKYQFEKSSPPPAVQTAPQLHLGDTVAKLEIPRLDAQLYVVEGVDAGDLRRGPGHMPGTAMPGRDGNCVIAAHRDTHFRILKDIRKGDDIVLQTQSGQFLYRVRNTSIVSPRNVSSIQATPNPVLHLITCYPFYYVGNAPKRFVVEAELAGSVNASNVPNEPQIPRS